MLHLIIFSALYIEAEPLIRKYGLKRTEALKGYACFQSEDGRILLAVSGSGKVAMAGAVAAALQGHACDHLLVFSSCAGLKGQQPGSVFLVNKVTDLESGRSYYPDLLYQSTLTEGSLLCGEIPLGIHLKNREIPKPYDPQEYPCLSSFDLYDMDTCGAVWTAGKFLGPHQISIVKTVTDTGKKIAREQYEKYMETGFTRADPYIQSLLQMKTEKKEDPDALAGISQNLHCSAAMDARFRQLWRYAEASHQDLCGMMRDFQQEGIYPCSSREEGKKVLDALARKLTA